MKNQLVGVSTAHWPSCSYQPNDNSQILATWQTTADVRSFGPRGSLSDLNRVSLRDISIFCHSSIIRSATLPTFHLPKAPLGVDPWVVLLSGDLQAQPPKASAPEESWRPRKKVALHPLFEAKFGPVLVSVLNTHTQKFWWISVSVAHVFFWKLEQEMMGDRWDPDPTMDGIICMNCGKRTWVWGDVEDAFSRVFV